MNTTPRARRPSTLDIAETCLRAADELGQVAARHPSAAESDRLFAVVDEVHDGVEALHHKHARSKARSDRAVREFLAPVRYVEVAPQAPVRAGLKLTKVEEATALVAQPSCPATIADVARAVGCARQTLNGSPKFRKTWKTVRAIALVKSGSKYDGRVEATDTEPDSE